MASNKNQHYVPKCLLKPFTHNCEGRFISLFNLDRRRLIPNAPVKNQCSGDYFYGRDPELDKAIQALETSYGCIRDEILASRYALTTEHRDFLIRFWLMQHLRTEGASRRIAEMANQADDFFQPEGHRLNMEVREAVQTSMRIYSSSIDSVSDLGGCLLRNTSNCPFVSSDDPAVISNRMYLHHSGIRDRTFSLVTAGALLMLPISPKVMFLAYDRDVYSIIRRDGWVQIHRDSDVDALNQHQFLNCRANIFLDNDRDSDYVASSLVRLSSRRVAVSHKTTFMIPYEESAGFARYRVVTRKEAEGHDGDVLTMWQNVHAKPESWPQQIALRQGAHAYSNGSSVGWVRRAQIRSATARPFVRINLN